MALHLQQLEGLHHFGIRQPTPRMLLEEALDTGGRSIQENRDVAIASGPRVVEQLLAFVLKQARQMITQPVERLAQRFTPTLVPPRLAPRLAAAVAPPALDAMDTAPGRVVEDFNDVIRRKAVEILTIIRQRRQALAVDRRQRIGQGHLPEAVVMPVGLAIGSHMHQLGVVALIMEAAE